VFLDFDEDTISKNRLDVARVKLRTVRRYMIDTVLQLSIMGSLFDVWVVEERCGCRQEDSCGEEVSQGNSGGSSRNSGAEVWQGQNGDFFSDGTTDSDNSDAYQKKVDLQPKVGSKGVVLVGDSADAEFQECFRKTFPTPLRFPVLKQTNQKKQPGPHLLHLSDLLKNPPSLTCRLGPTLLIIKIFRTSILHFTAIPHKKA
jgi:hypothetical protein